MKRISSALIAYISSTGMLSLLLSSVISPGVANASSAKLLSSLSGLKVLKLPGQTGETFDFDSKKWQRTKDNDGTEFYSLKNPEAKTPAPSAVNAKAAVTRDTGGALQALTFYDLKSPSASATAAKVAKSSAASKKADKNSDQNPDENSATLFYTNGKMKAYTTCVDNESAPLKDRVGRVCVTTTPKLCQALRDGSGITPDILEEMNSFEEQALANILTLRGSEHQIDNLAKTGNRLGLKTALQTTKGQLLALARQVEKETMASEKIAEAVESSAGNSRAPANETRRTASAAPTADEKIARVVLEESIPRLKQSCLDTGFASTDFANQ